MSTKELSAQDIKAAAVAATGLSDFGDDPPLSPAFDRLIESINAEARLTEFGREARRQHLIHILSNRLRLSELLRRRPSLAEQKLGRLVIVVGLPRSGTTKLQRMLASNPQFNSILTWECLSPLPLSDAPDERSTRIAIGEQFCNAAKEHAPDFYAAHPLLAHEPEEDMVLMQHSFHTESVDAELRVPSFTEWLKTQDFTPMYRQFGLLLRVLAEQHGKVGQPWLLKGTYHGIHMDVLLKVFPDARIVYCHRDPIETIPSYASVTSKLRPLLSDGVDDREVGAELLRYWSWHQDHMMDVRARVPADAILDVPYQDIVRDASGVAERVYAFGGQELSPRARDAMKTWEAENAQHRHGKHAYDLRDYGLTEDAIAKACARYRARYITGSVA